MPGIVESSSQDAETVLLQAISQTPETFLHATPALRASALVVTSRLIGPVVKRSGLIDQLHTENMHIDQVWQQIKMVTNAVVDQILDMDLPEHTTDKARNVIDAIDDEEFSSPKDRQDNGLSEDEQDEFSPFESSDHDEYAIDGDADGNDNDVEELEGDIQEYAEDSGSMSDTDDEQDPNDQAREPFVQDVFGLNEGFFNIDDFNRQTEMMDANYAQEQSEDDLDYNADPDEASDIDDLELENDLDNANDIKYDDFFAPPKRQLKAEKPSSRKRARFNDEDLEEEASIEEPESNTIARMQKDLFADDDGAESEEIVGPKLSSHAKRQMRLAEEIRQLENENVSKKDWTLMGEASARARPKDSLIEEGLDFERTSKPVPIVTEETTQTLEDMIKARIIAGQFDTVIRKIPDSVYKFSKNSFELDDTKPSQSLAEVYETEFQKKQDPSGYKSAHDKKKEAEHKEIAALFKDLCYDLDSLSSWHYTPKPATESLTIVSNTPAIDMEEAQPLTMSSASRLAPQEQYTPKAEKGEVIGKSGLPQSKAEMSTEERQRHRRKQRAAAKKSGAQKKDSLASMSKSKQEQAGVINTLKSGNVKVIRNGQTKDLRTGRDYNGSTKPLSSSRLKL